MAKNLCNDLDAVGFVKAFEKDCVKVAERLEVPIENILGLAAQESQYGKGRIAVDLKNYFSMHAPAPLQIGAEHPKDNKKIKVAKFSKFKDCAESFESRFGHAVKGKTDPLAFAQALVAVRFNTGKAEDGGRANFVPYLVSIINAVKGRRSC
ncbi:glucosaminidase domain-containing protein [Massilia genomosp. 1]|uniref:Mannosyl-glycoprotein endo-beta-N-acetylglucosamidase-like domain-containing protein n=1 Tax=Massilia genomosp. 1 TaxID=2609280 RepID=A0ABX0N3P7_9BURK|nr:glucosaminidase domain-containing protein [Massilia genomosp. 1]NHZ67026.1 hypothetical protein [Massilia genomosp. 1]